MLGIMQEDKMKGKYINTETEEEARKSIKRIEEEIRKSKEELAK